MIKHPEQQLNEKYLGNTMNITIPKYLKHIPSLRYGTVAYGLNSKLLSKIEQSFYRPVFVARDELYLYDEAMMTLTFPDQKYYRPQGI